MELVKNKKFGMICKDNFINTGFRQFMNNLRENELKIADKILSEEENLKKKMRLMPQLFQDRLKPLKVY